MAPFRWCFTHAFLSKSDCPHRSSTLTASFIQRMSILASHPVLAPTLRRVLNQAKPSGRLGREGLLRVPQCRVSELKCAPAVTEWPSRSARQPACLEPASPCQPQVRPPTPIHQTSMFTMFVQVSIATSSITCSWPRVWATRWLTQPSQFLLRTLVLHHASRKILNEV